MILIGQLMGFLTKTKWYNKINNQAECLPFILRALYADTFVPKLPICTNFR